MIPLRLALLAIAVLVGIQKPASPRSSSIDDWPIDRHDSSSTGRSLASIRPPLAFLWRVKASGSTLLASGGVICIGSEPGLSGETHKTHLFNDRGQHIRTWADSWPLYLKGERIVLIRSESHDPDVACVRWRDDTTIWRHKVESSGPFGMPSWTGTAYGNTLYWAENLPTYKTALRSISISDGRHFKEFVVKLTWGEGPPACDGMHVYWGDGHWLHSFNAKTLKPEWAIFDGGNAYPILHRHTLLVQGWMHVANGWSLKSKKSLWRIRAERGAAHCLANPPGRSTVLIEQANDPPAVVGIDPETGKIRWHNWHVSMESLAVSAGRYVFFAGQRIKPGGELDSNSNGLKCLDSRDGRIIWEYPTGGAAYNHIIVSGQSVYGITPEGYLYRFDSTARLAH